MPRRSVSDGELLKELSKAFVQMQKEFAGRGPTRAKTYWAGNDLLVVLMGGGYTAAEQTLFEGGRGGAVRDSRHAFQDVMGDRMTQVIEELTGRQVVAFMSASHQSPDLVLEAFVLQPTDEDSPVTAPDQVDAE